MRDHTSLLAWQAAHGVAVESLALCRDHWKPWASAAFGQLQRAALSVQLNIAEGYASGSSPRQQFHYGIAYSSAVETGDILRVLDKVKLVGPQRLAKLRAENVQCQRLLRGLVRRVPTREFASASKHESPCKQEQEPSDRCQIPGESEAGGGQDIQAPGK